MTKTARIILALSLAYPLYVAFMVSVQTMLMFPGASLRHRSAITTVPAGAKRIEVPVSFGNALAVYWPPVDTSHPAPAIWFAHGNAETVSDSFKRVQPLLQQGFAVLVMEFPGYADADGAPSFASVNEAAEATWDWLAAQHAVDPDRMIAMGYSIGGGATAELTRSKSVRALVLLSTYTSIADMAHRYGLPAWFVRFPWNNVSRVRQFNGPVYVEHGRHDWIIPFAIGRKLAGTRPDIEFQPLDCGHDDCDFVRSVFASRLPAWLAAHGIAHANSP